MGIYEELQERGLLAQVTHEDEVRELLNSGKCTFYIGFDPTADSLHVGHYMQMMIMARMQRAGNKPIALIGGGTAMIGDPSGRSDMRQMMTIETINHNCECFKKQMSKIIEFGENKAVMVNNADWLRNLNYIDFIRDNGVHYSVNRMLSAECFKQRLERGLSFLEFNYMLMQGYDFYKLNEDYGCNLQLGGDDQWSNILGGIELIRKRTQKSAYGMTFTLLTNSEGKKMGKTQKGAVWLDPEKTSPYDFYQYWRNVDDADVVRFLKMLTFLSVSEIDEKYGSLEGSALNTAKEVLAYEITKQVHGVEEADKAQEAAKKLFGAGGVSDNMPEKTVSAELFADGACGVLDIAVASGVCPSKREARTLVEQGGILVDDVKITDVKAMIEKSAFDKGYIVLKKGKKTVVKITIE